MYTKITCPICKKQMLKITNKHLNTHGLTHASFKNQFPDALIESPELRRTYGSQSKETRLKIKETRTSQKLQRNEEYLKNPKMCANCKVPLSYENRNNSYCSHSCGASASNKIRVLSPTAVENISQGAKRVYKENFSKSPSHNTIPYCKLHTNSCVICSGLFLSRYKNKQTCSPTCKSKYHALYNHRQNKTKGKCGYYKGIWCASTWELAFVVYNIDHGKHITRCNKTYSYTFNKKERLYFPDFYMDGTIYEIKGRFTDDVPIKIQSVVSTGDDIILIDKNSIAPYIQYVKTAYNVKDLTHLYD